VLSALSYEIFFCRMDRKTLRSSIHQGDSSHFVEHLAHFVPFTNANNSAQPLKHGSVLLVFSLAN